MQENRSYQVIGGIKVIRLHGSWHGMGRQYGTAAAEELHEVYAYILGKLDNDKSRTLKYDDIAAKLFANYPDYLKEFLEGESETSGLGRDELIRVNALEYAEAAFFCSGLALWGPYTADGELIYGRNYDAFSYAELSRDIVVTAFHPDDGSIPTAIIGYAGELYAVNALNAKGIFIELNNGMPSAGWDIHYEMRPSTCDLLSLALSAGTMEEVDSFFCSNESFASFIIGVADRNEARVYEWCTDGFRRADHLTPEGLAVLTNHYVHPDWPYPVPTDAQSWNSHIRRDNILRQAGTLRGRACAGDVAGIMQTPIDGGGPMHEATRYQMVVEPATLTLSIRIAPCSTSKASWIRLEMSEFLR